MGTGLGLYIIYNLVKQKLKGEIYCESLSGKGLAFVIRIPLMEEGKESDE